MSEWYYILNTLSAAISAPVNELSANFNVPLLSAVLLGVIGAASPCQLSTNFAALGFISRNAADSRYTLRAAFSYLAGKALIYTLLGAVIVALGLSLTSASVPVWAVVRRAMGPLFFLSGLFMLGLFPLNFAFGAGVSGWIEKRLHSKGASGAFFLGVAFSFVFCPTLFLLFFGLLLPMSLGTREGFALPAFFALGTALPLLVLSLLLSLSARAARGYLQGARRWDPIARRIVGVVFLLVGLNEIVTYWLV